MLSEECWKQISLNLFYHAEVSNQGRVRIMDAKGYRYLKGNFTRGGYHRVKLKLLNGHRKTFFIHRLVALAFIPIPEEGIFNKLKKIPLDGIPYMVNHIDAITSNNYYTNLEWCDDLHNARHATDNCYKSRFITCMVTNIIDGTVKYFKTAKSLACFLNVTASSLPAILYNHTDIPYMNKYIFQAERLFIENRIKGMDLICKDYISKAIYVTNNIYELSSLIYTKKNSIRNRLIDKSIKLLNGCVIMRLTDFNNNWPVYTDDEILKSRNVYKARIESGQSKTTKTIICKDYITGNILKFNSGSEAASYFNYSYKHLLSYVNSNYLYDGKAFINEDYYSNTTSDGFPDFTAEEIQHSIYVKKMLDQGHRLNGNERSVTAINTITKEVKLFNSILQASKETGVYYELVKKCCTYPGIRYPNGWDFTYNTL